MHLKSVKLTNFRCFEDLTLELHPKLTVLVSENGGGKTAILDGIAIGLGPILKYLSSANQRLSGPGIEDNDFRLEAWEGRGGFERWGATEYVQIAMEAQSGLKWDQWRGASTGKQPELKIGQAELAGYASGLLESSKTKDIRMFPVFAYYGARRGLIEIPERLRESKIAYDHPTSALVGSLDAQSDFKEMMKWFDAEEASELRSNKGAGPEDFLESDTLQAVRTAIEVLLGGEFKNPHFNRKHRFVVESKNGPDVLAVEQLSQGYQSMLAMGMDFARRLALGNDQLRDLDPASSDWHDVITFAGRVLPHAQGDTPILGPIWAPAIMLVDEIDLHLHPSWQQRVLNDLIRAFPGTQFVVTSHSPQVLSTVPMECIRIIKDQAVHSAPAGTDGAEAQRILEDVFQVPARPKTEMALVLDEYLRLIDDRKWDSGRARELRQRLDSWSKGQEPRLKEADLQIENMKWEASN